MSSDEIVDVIDEHDQFLYYVPRCETVTRKLRCRVVHSFLIDRATQHIMLLVRSRHSGFCPLHFGAVGGYVQSGETWERAAMREVLEEVGIDTTLRLLETYAVTDPVTKLPFIDGVFVGLINRADVVIDTEAVEEVVFLTWEAIQKMNAEQTLMHPLLADEITVLARHYDQIL